MQAVYALQQSDLKDLKSEEKFLQTNIYKLQDLYVHMLSLLVEIRKEAERLIEISKKKHLPSDNDLNPNRKFIENKVFLSIENSPSYKDFFSDKNENIWQENEEYVKILFKAIRESAIYEKYMSSPDNSLEEDKIFIEDVYTNIIVVNDKLFNFIEDTNIGWSDDFPFVNTWLLKTLKNLYKNKFFKISPLFNNNNDEEFVLDLFKNVVEHQDDFSDDIDAKTPNWDNERIANLDLVLIKMALVEFLFFPTIPTKVTINEYLEIAKDYSTEKSSVFINGVLDKLLRQYEKENKIKKVGRGLL